MDGSRASIAGALPGSRAAESVSVGLADMLWIDYTTKEAMQRLQSFVRWRFRIGIVGRQHNLLRWMDTISKEDVQPHKRSIA